MRNMSGEDQRDECKRTTGEVSKRKLVDVKTGGFPDARISQRDDLLTALTTSGIQVA
jgi:hypothetical protein